MVRWAMPTSYDLGYRTARRACISCCSTGTVSACSDCPTHLSRGESLIVTPTGILDGGCFKYALNTSYPAYFDASISGAAALLNGNDFLIIWQEDCIWYKCFDISSYNLQAKISYEGQTEPAMAMCDGKFPTYVTLCELRVFLERISDTGILAFQFVRRHSTNNNCTAYPDCDDLCAMFTAKFTFDFQENACFCPDTITGHSPTDNYRSFPGTTCGMNVPAFSPVGYGEIALDTTSASFSIRQHYTGECK